MTIDDKLREAMKAEASVVRGDPDAWAKVQAEVRSRGTATRRTTAILAAAAVLTVVVGIGAFAAWDGDDGEIVRAGPGPADTTTTTTTSAADRASTFLDAVWPFTTVGQLVDYAADPGEGVYLDPEKTALAFARDYLGMPNPSRATEISTNLGTVPSYEVTLRPKPNSPLRTTILLREAGGPSSPIRLPSGGRLDSQPVLLVTGARTANIVIDQATPDRPAGSADLAVRVQGVSTAFEATIQFELRAIGQEFGERLATTFLMGGANGELGPFEGTLTVAYQPVVIVLYADSAEDGSIQEATVRLVVAR